MNRRGRTIGLFVLLGVIANIVLAWIFAALGSVDAKLTSEVLVVGGHLRQERGPMPDALEWPGGAPDSWPSPNYRQVMRGRGVYITLVRGTAILHENYQATVARFGWPFHSLQWSQSSVHDRVENEQTVNKSPWITAPDWLEEFASSQTQGFPVRRRLPIVPAWPGFAINTVLFACGFWLILRSAGAYRRFLRRRRGQCPACGYPTGTSAVCTECGQPVHTRRRLPA